MADMHWSQEFIYSGTWVWHPGAEWFVRNEDAQGINCAFTEPEPFRNLLFVSDDAPISAPLSTYMLDRFDVYSYSARAHVYAMRGDRDDIDRMLALLDMAMRFLVFAIGAHLKPEDPAR